MAEFKDKLGREWVLDLTVADLKRVRQATGVEFTVGGGASLYDQIGKLAGDLELMGRAVWVLVKNQAEEKGVDEESFAEGLNRDTIRASALALMDAFLDFYHGPAAVPMKEAVRAVMEKTEAAAGIKIAAMLKAAVETENPEKPSPSNPSPSNGSVGSTRDLQGSTLGT